MAVVLSPGPVVMTWRGVGWGVVVAIALAISWLWSRIERVPTDFEIAVGYLNEQRPDLALLFFRQSTWSGVAAFRAGRFAQAARMFGADETVLSLYNLGNSYAHLRDWPNAITTYQRVLRFDPAHEDALYNLALVQKAIEPGGNPAEPMDVPAVPPSESESLEMPIPQDSDAQQARSGETEQSDATGNTSYTDQPGDTDPRKNPRPTEKTGEVGAAAAVGEAGDDRGGDDRRIVGSVDLKQRSSGRSMEVLLGKIRDDPETVLRARLLSVYQSRVEGDAE
jgi:Ca-activated chloride channel family protein